MNHARTSTTLGLTLLTGLAVLSACAAGPTDPVAATSEALINGTVSNGVYTGVASFEGAGCSSVLIAPRVMLTSAHCVPSWALECTTLAQSPLNLVFAEANGGFTDQASYDARTVAVQGLVHRPELFDLSQCSASDTFNCSDIQRENIDHSKELVVLYLADEAPSGAQPLPVMINANVDASHSAAEVGIKADLASWVENQKPLITTVGYGIGSHAYTVGSGSVRGRDYGVQRWISTHTSFWGFLGAQDCNTSNPTSNPLGVVVRPDDLDFNDTGDPDLVAPGTQFPGSQQSHSGSGDSGGPALVGLGPASHNVAPTALPAPTAQDSYDPARNYVVGTASLWVGTGTTLSTAFTPTWTQGASEFLMSALHDEDTDGYADPVDDDKDNDLCENDVDQHPDDRYVPIGTILHVNCNPSHSAWLGDESTDLDADGILSCEDTDDDADGLADEDDDCPMNAGPFCFKFGQTCPWNPLFFSCRGGGCNELLVKLSSLVNPDPTALFHVLASESYSVTVSAPTGLSLEEGARLLAGGRVATRSIAGDRELLELEVVGPDGRTRGSIAAYDPTNVRIGALRGATALQLRIARDGKSLEVLGAQAPQTR